MNQYQIAKCQWADRYAVVGLQTDLGGDVLRFRRRKLAGVGQQLPDTTTSEAGALTHNNQLIAGSEMPFLKV